METSPDIFPTDGLFAGIPDDQYHASQTIGSSDLKKVLRSPAHYAVSRPELNPNWIPQVETDALRIGKAYHAMILEPASFVTRFAIWRGADRRTKVGKAEYAELLTQNAGKTILSAEEYAKLSAMREVALANPTVAGVLQAGASEVSFVWTDPETGVRCKCRPDWYRSDLLIADLKSTRDAGLSSFSRDMVSYGYYISAAHYLMGYEQVIGESLDGNFLLIAQEKDPPYAIGSYAIADAALSRGRVKVQQALQRIARCRQRGQWEGYDTQVQTITLPGWAFDE